MKRDKALELLRNGKEDYGKAYIYLKSGNTMRLTRLSKYSFEEEKGLIKLKKEMSGFLRPTTSNENYVQSSQIEAINFYNNSM